MFLADNFQRPSMLKVPAMKACIRDSSPYVAPRHALLPNNGITTTGVIHKPETARNRGLTAHATMKIKANLPFVAEMGLDETIPRRSKHKEQVSSQWPSKYHPTPCERARPQQFTPSHNFIRLGGS